MKRRNVKWFYILSLIGFLLSSSLHAQKYKVQIEYYLGLPTINSGSYGILSFSGGDLFNNTNADPIRLTNGTSRYDFGTNKTGVLYGFSEVRDYLPHDDVADGFAGFLIDTDTWQYYRTNLGVLAHSSYQFSQISFDNPPYIVFEDSCTEYRVDALYEDNDELSPSPVDGRQGYTNILRLTFVSTDEELEDARPFFSQGGGISINTAITSSNLFRIASGTEMNMMEVSIIGSGVWETMNFSTKSTWRLRDFYTDEQLDGRNVVFRGVVCSSYLWTEDERVYTTNVEELSIFVDSVGLSDYLAPKSNTSCVGATDGSIEVSFQDTYHPIPDGQSVYMTLYKVESVTDDISTLTPYRPPFIINNEDLYDDGYHYLIDNLEAGQYVTRHKNIGYNDPDDSIGSVVGASTEGDGPRDPTPVEFSTDVEEPICVGALGTITIEASGGKEYIYSSFSGPISRPSSRSDGIYQFSLEGVTDSGDDVSTAWLSESDTSDTYTFDNLEPGSYDIYVRLHVDGLTSCYLSDSVEISPPAVIDFSFNTDFTKFTPSYPTALDGRIEVYFENGSPPFTPSITNQDTGDVITLATSDYISPRAIEFSDLQAGTYDVLLIDNNGCEITYTDIQLQDPPPIVIGEIGITEIPCFDSNDGVIQLNSSNVSGGSSSVYFYELTYPDLTKQVSGLAYFPNLEKGSYLLKVSSVNDFNNTNAYSSKTIEIGSGLSQVQINSVVTQDAVCFTDSGSIIVDVEGGAPPYSYRIGSGGFTALPVSNEIGVTSTIFNQNFSIRDSNDCEVTHSNLISVSKPSNALAVTFKRQTDNTINGASNGSIVLDVFGGYANSSALLYNFTVTKDNLAYTPTINYSASTFEHSIVNLPKGVYRVRVTDDKGCEVLITDIITITEPEELVISAISIDTAIDCKDGTGILEVSATGGSESYTYEWKRDTTVLADIDNILENAQAGNYTVTVNDGFTTDTSAIFNFQEPAQVTFTVVKTDISCYAEGDGTVVITPEGGNSDYVYSTDNKATFSSLSSLTSNTITGLGEGDHTIWLQDTNGCEAISSQTVNIAEPSEIVIVEVTNTVIEERGANTGALEASVVGGTGVLTSVWTRALDAGFSETNLSLTNLYADSYTLTVTDTNGCEVSRVFEVQQPEELEVSILETTSIACFGDETGELTAVASGGFPIAAQISDYVFSWEKIEADSSLSPIISGNGENTLSNIGVGNYQVTISDTKGVSTFDTFEVLSPELLAIGTPVITPENCYGDNGAAVQVTVTGGPKDEVLGTYLEYTYAWTKVGDPSFSANTQNLIDINEGGYELAVTDANGCTANLEVTVALTNPKIEFSNLQGTDLTGFETANGRISFEVTGGTGDLSYSWTMAEDPLFTANTKDIDNLARGTYSLVVTDASGCTQEIAQELIEPNALEVSLSEEQANNCYDGNTADLTANVTGGFPLNATATDYSYQWFKIEDTVEQELLGELNSVLFDQSFGTYKVMVSDINGNTNESTIIITAPDELRLANILIKEIDCYGDDNGSISVDVIGGPVDGLGNYQAYQYLWIKEGDTSFSSDTKDIANLSAGSYVLSIVDANLCMATFTAIEIQAIDQELSAEVTLQRDLTGFETNNGSIDITVLGGTPPYTYVWEQAEDINFSELTEDISGLSQGNYSVLITDAHGCTTATQATVTQPELLEVGLSIDTSITCKDTETGAIMAVVNGGVEAYTYNWFKVEGTVETPLTDTEALLTTIAAGLYKIQVVDANGNEAVSTIEIGEPDAIAISDTAITNVTCNRAYNGSIAITLVGGTAPYTFVWSNGVRTQNLNNIGGGTYEVRITDTKGCEYTEVFEVTEPNALQTLGDTVRIYPSSATATDGRISVTIIGGTPPYLYEWKNSAGQNAFIEMNAAGLTTINNTTSEIYGLEVTDANNCVLSIPDVNDIEVLALEAIIVQQNVLLCSGETTASIQASVQGGIPFNSALSYTYEWFNANTGTSIGANLPEIQDLGEGSYYVRVTDAVGVRIQSDSIEITAPNVLEAEDLEATFINCGTGEDWNISTNVTGGTPPYRYFWNKSTVDAPTIENVASGFYTVSIVDFNGCSVEKSITLTPPAALEITESITIPLCYDACTGEISLSATGGTAPYSYSWDNGQSTALVQNLCPGIYEVTLTDAKSCSITTSFEIINPALFEIDLGEDITLCKDQSILLDATIDSGVSYVWSSDNGFSSNEAQVVVNETGMYSVTITNTDNCVATDSIFIEAIDTVISADFIAASQVFSGESFVMVNIADPLPDAVEWIMPNGAIIVSKDDTYVELFFEIAGEYEITFSVDLGLCHKQVTKKVVVLDKDITTDENTGSIKAETFINYNVYPNPSTKGELHVAVDTSTEVELHISLFHPGSSSMLLQRTTDKKLDHLEDFDVSGLPAGLYFVIIESSLGNQVLKLIIE